MEKGYFAEFLFDVQWLQDILNLGGFWYISAAARGGIGRNSVGGRVAFRLEHGLSVILGCIPKHRVKAVEGNILLASDLILRGMRVCQGSSL